MRTKASLMSVVKLLAVLTDGPKSLTNKGKPKESQAHQLCRPAAQELMNSVSSHVSNAGWLREGGCSILLVLLAVALEDGDQHQCLWKVFGHSGVYKGKAMFPGFLAELCASARVEHISTEPQMAVPRGLEPPLQAPELMPAKAFISGVDDQGRPATRAFESQKYEERSSPTWSYL